MLPKRKTIWSINAAFECCSVSMHFSFISGFKKIVFVGHTWQILSVSTWVNSSAYTTVYIFDFDLIDLA